MEAAEKYERKRTTEKRTLCDYIERHEMAYQINETKSLINFNE